MTNLDELCINALRFLSIDAVEKARSGHPGAPMGMAVMAYTLWHKHLRHDPHEPGWPDRDRFVLSAGHASALLYSLLHLYGYPMPLEELQKFRQLGSMTPGHPEYDPDTGVETTTGPLGQGFANAVGMAIVERWLAARFNKPGFNIVDHYTYVMASDGDMMEGVTSEAASLAGSLGLNNLICLYDDNNISIEGSTDVTFTEDVGARFRAYGWHVIGPIDGLDADSVDMALNRAKSIKDKPVLIVCTTCIGYGSPGKAGTASAHGEPLGPEEVTLTRHNLGWKWGPFEVPPEARDQFSLVKEQGRLARKQWQAMIEDYAMQYPDDAGRYFRQIEGNLPQGWEESLENIEKDLVKPMATREASGVVLNALAQTVDNLMGGSADLAPSNKTIMKGAGDFNRQDYNGRNLHFGVREHAMGAIANGMCLHGGVIPYVGTFLIFYDYMRPPVRLAALMGLGVIYVYTHDSIGLGEDGPTHQPVEQLMGLRLVPGVVTLRPADGFETLEAWKVALKRRHGPTALVLTRQKLPVIDTATGEKRAVDKGAYVLWQSGKEPELLIMASGSEVNLALEAGRQLKDKGIESSVISMPSWELFNIQPQDYRDSVLPPGITRRISVEAGRSLGWQRYTGTEGVNIAVDKFGASAPWEQVYQSLGINVDNIVKAALKMFPAGDC
ncbi:MAG: transketolase [Dehalococcoidaceae bacterium]|nr:transketolase [Dehalococcoidaceae bacterium]